MEIPAGRAARRFSRLVLACGSTCATDRSTSVIKSGAGRSRSSAAIRTAVARAVAELFKEQPGERFGLRIAQHTRLAAVSVALQFSEQALLQGIHEHGAVPFHKRQYISALHSWMRSLGPPPGSIDWRREGRNPTGRARLRVYHCGYSLVDCLSCGHQP